MTVPLHNVRADGRGVVSHAGSRLLADLADTTGLITASTDALRQLRLCGIGQAPGRIAVDLAVTLADGGEAIADLALLRDRPRVFGPVASSPTAWRLPASTGPAALGALRAARATAHEVAWLQAGERRLGGPAPLGLRLDLSEPSRAGPADPGSPQGTRRPCPIRSPAPARSAATGRRTPRTTGPRKTKKQGPIRPSGRRRLSASRSSSISQFCSRLAVVVAQQARHLLHPYARELGAAMDPADLVP